MGPKHVAVTVDPATGLAEVVLDRPKVNALNRELIADLGDAFARVAGDAAIRGALVRGEGRGFCAGLDLNEVGTLDHNGIASFIEVFDVTFTCAFRCPKPVAAAVHGHAVAGGLVLALVADFVALAPDTRLGLTELVVGVPFPRVAFEIVREALPPRSLRQFLYGASLCGAREAFDLGVGDVLAGDPTRAAREWLAQVVDRPAAVFRHTKAQVREAAWARTAAATLEERKALLRDLGLTR
jgi:enoyl-CoA hydratase